MIRDAAERTGYCSGTPGTFKSARLELPAGPNCLDRSQHNTHLVERPFHSLHVFIHFLPGVVVSEEEWKLGRGQEGNSQTQAKI